MSELSIKGILLGVLTDTGGNTIAGIVLMVIFASSRITPDMSEQEINDAILALAQGGGFLLASLIVGLGFTILGGYVAARVAKKGIYQNSATVGAIDMLLGILFTSASARWFDIAGFLIVIPAALLGGHLARKQVNRTDL
jgi:hypothetical protein